MTLAYAFPQQLLTDSLSVNALNAEGGTRSKSHFLIVLLLAMGRTSMDPGPGNNGRGSVYSYGRSQDAGSVRYAPGPESVRSHPPMDASRGGPPSYAPSNRGSYYPPESHRSYPPPESHRSYHPPPDSQKSFPLESHRSYPVDAPDSRASLYDKIVLAEMLLGSLFGIFGIATMNWRGSGENIFNAEQECKQLMHTDSIVTVSCRPYF